MTKDDTESENLFAAAVEADRAYQAALERTYGSKAADYRYDVSTNAATDELREAKAKLTTAVAAWWMATIKENHE